MNAFLKRVYVEHAFRPSLFGLVTNPFYIARKGLYQNLAALAPHVTGRVLDVGCGNKPYRDLFRVSSYLGLELDTPENRVSKRADCFYDGKRFPFADGSFDTVVATEVLEHIFNPGDFVRELNRVLHPEGGLLLTVPFVWDEHEQPLDYARYSSFGLKHLLESYGFSIIEHRKSVCGFRVHVQLLLCYLHKQVDSWPSLLKAGAWVVFSAPLNLAGDALGWILPSNRDLYLDNVVFARKVRAHA